MGLWNLLDHFIATRKELDSLKGEIARSEAREEEAKRRIDALEKVVSESNATAMDRHKLFISIVMGATALVVGLMAYMSNQNARDTLQMMHAGMQDLGRKSDQLTAETKEAITQMKRDFQALAAQTKGDFQMLAGDALKKPFLQANMEDGLPMEGRTNLVPREIGSDRWIIRSLFLTNSGDRRTDPLSIRLSSDSRPEHVSVWNDEWEIASSPQTNFPTSLICKRPGITVAPGQSINIPSIEINPFVPSGVLHCELEVFYGGERPLRTRFYLSLPRQ